MLLGLSFIVIWAGQAFALAGAKGWPLQQLLLGNWGPAVDQNPGYSRTPDGHGGYFLVPNDPNKGGTHHVAPGGNT